MVVAVDDAVEFVDVGVVGRAVLADAVAAL
jgi:hypothetical protein